MAEGLSDIVPMKVYFYMISLVLSCAELNPFVFCPLIYFGHLLRWKIRVLRNKRIQTRFDVTKIDIATVQRHGYGAESCPRPM